MPSLRQLKYSATLFVMALILPYTRKSTAQAQASETISAQYPAILARSVNTTATPPAAAHFNQAMTHIFLAGGGFCLNKFDIASGKTTAADTTTLAANNCVGITLYANETRALALDNKMGGLIVYDLTTPMPTVLGKLSGFNAYAAVLSDDERYAYVAASGASEARLLIINLNDPTRPSLMQILSYPWTVSTSSADGIPNEFEFSLARLPHGLIMTRNIFPQPAPFTITNGQKNCVAGVLLVDIRNATNPITTAEMVWAINSNPSEKMIAIAPPFLKGSRLGLPFFVVDGSSYGAPRGAQPGVILYDITNTSSPQETARFMQSAANALDIAPDGTLFIGTDSGVSVVLAQKVLIPGDPPEIFHWPVAGGVKTLKISADGRFVHVIAKNGRYSQFAIQDLLSISKTGVTVLPILSGNRTTLATQEANRGQLACFAARSAPTPNTPALEQVPCNMSSGTNTSWFAVNAEGAFTATPPADAPDTVVIGTHTTHPFSVAIRVGKPLTATATNTSSATASTDTQTSSASTTSTSTDTASTTEQTTTPATELLNPPTPEVSLPRNTRAANQAPSITITDGQETQTVPLEQFWVVKPNATDPDGDPLLVSFALNGGPLPPTVLAQNNAVVGTCSRPDNFTITATAFDGAQYSASATYRIICQYFPPALSHTLGNMTFPVNAQGITYTIPPNTFSGSNLQWFAKLANGDPLPQGVTFDTYAHQISVRVEKDTALWLMLMVRDLFGYSANTTFWMHFVDPAPTVNKPLTRQTIMATRTRVIALSGVFAHANNAPLTLTVTLANGASIPPWCVYNPETQTLTMTPPASNQTITFLATARDPYGKSTGMNFTVSVPPNQPPIVHQILSNKTVVTGATLTYLIPSDAFISPQNNTLTMTATGMNASALATFLTFANAVLSGTPSAADAVANNPLPVEIIVSDALGGTTRQTIYLTITLSTWDQVLYYLDIAWKAAAAIASLGVVITAYGYYQQWPIIRNILRGKGYVADIQFHHNQCNLTQLFEGEICVTSLRRVSTAELLCVDSVLASLVKPFSYYAHGRHTLFKHENGDDFPAWLTCDSKILTVHPELITDNAQPVVVQVTTLAGRILAQYAIDPQRYKAHHTAVEMKPVSRQSSVSSTDTPKTITSPASPRGFLSQPLLKEVPRQPGFQIARIPDDAKPLLPPPPTTTAVRTTNPLRRS